MTLGGGLQCPAACERGFCQGRPDGAQYRGHVKDRAQQTDLRAILENTVMYLNNMKNIYIASQNSLVNEVQCLP